MKEQCFESNERAKVNEMKSGKAPWPDGFPVQLVSYMVVLINRVRAGSECATREG